MYNVFFFLANRDAPSRCTATDCLVYKTVLPETKMLFFCLWGWGVVLPRWRGELHIVVLATYIYIHLYIYSHIWNVESWPGSRVG